MTLIERKIGDDCLVGDGAHAKIQRQQTGIIYITSKNIKNERLDSSNIDYISEEDFSKYFKANSKAIKKPQKGDVLLCIIGASIGDSCFVTIEDYVGLSSSVAILRANQSILCPKYLYYWTRGYIFQDGLRRIRSGSAQGFLSLEMVRSLPLYYPNLITQQRIADILSSYDRFIDNNNRRIALLEESIHLLYKEWFVRSRFPGYESVKIVDGIPEGWKNSTIGDTFTIMGGGTPSKNIQQYWQDGTITWYSPTDLTKSKTMFMEKSGSQITSVGLANSSARLFPPFSVMMTSRATIGVVSINTTEACTNQGFITCIPNDKISLYFLYCWIKANTEIFYNLASGATFKEISKGIFKNILIIIPDATIINKFEDKAKAYGNLILILQKENQYLYEARDLLLPRLMNGSIAV